MIGSELDATLYSGDPKIRRLVGLRVDAECLQLE
jgi:hypothetical protein